jgi:hypothetical protein
MLRAWMRKWLGVEDMAETLARLDFDHVKMVERMLENHANGIRRIQVDMNHIGRQVESGVVEERLKGIEAFCGDVERRLSKLEPAPKPKPRRKVKR